MLTDFSQFVWYWAAEPIFVVLACTLAGAVLLAVLHAAVGRGRRFEEE